MAFLFDLRKKTESQTANSITMAKDFDHGTSDSLDAKNVKSAGLPAFEELRHPRTAEAGEESE